MMRELTLNEVWFLVQAVRWTLLLAFLAFLGGGVVGLVIAILRVAETGPWRLIAATYIKIFKGTPLLVQLFLAYFGVNLLGLRVDSWTAAALGLTLHSSAFLGEIWRGCIQAVPLTQWEGAKAMGLGSILRLRLVILPQAFRIAIPPTVGFSVHLVKSTSVASIIGFTELTRAAQMVNNATFRPFIVFAIVATLYFVLCWPLSRLGQRLERRFDRDRQQTVATWA
jgi:polar amino acid transport system permease protein